MSKSTNTVVYLDWKTVIYIYVCGKCCTQLMLPMEKSVTFTGACANEIIPAINRSFVYKTKEGRHVRILDNRCFVMVYPSYIHKGIYKVINSLRYTWNNVTVFIVV